MITVQCMTCVGTGWIRYDGADGRCQECSGTGLITAIQMSVTELIQHAHSESKRAGWYDTPHERGTKIALIHSEISEALEGERREAQDNHLPHRKMAEVELADAIIRICDYAGWRGFDLESAIIEKMQYNRNRTDHKRDHRAGPGGKQF